MVWLIGVSSWAAEAPKSAGQPWHSDLKSAWETASEQQRPLLVFLTTDGCAYCQKMKQTTLRDKGVQVDVSTRFIPVVLNAKDEPDLVKLLKIRVYPSVVVIEPSGDVVESISGYQTAKQLRDKLAPKTRQAAREKPSRTVR
jgi:thioredoxin-related protein